MTEIPHLRLFFALGLPLYLAEELIRRFREQTNPNLRWTRPERLHLTLRFWGHFAADRIPKLISAGQAAAAKSEALPLHVDSLGAFPSQARARVHWAGIGEPGRSVLCRLATRLDDELAHRGIARESRPFRPHLTVARVRTRMKSEPPGRSPGPGINPDRVELQGLRWTAQGLLLVESRLTPHPTYEILDCADFAAHGSRGEAP